MSSIVKASRREIKKRHTQQMVYNNLYPEKKTNVVELLWIQSCSQGLSSAAQDDVFDSPQSDDLAVELLN